MPTSSEARIITVAVVRDSSDEAYPHNMFVLTDVHRAIAQASVHVTIKELDQKLQDTVRRHRAQGVHRGQPAADEGGLAGRGGGGGGDAAHHMLTLC